MELMRGAGPGLRWRRRRLRGHRRAVTAVIGTLLALLVFLSIFGIFLTQYVPLWMTENELQLSITVANQMAQIKHDVDLLALEGLPGRSVSDPVTMQSQGVPVFAQPTQGILTFSQNQSLWTNVSFPLYALDNGVPQLEEPGFFQNTSSDGVLTMHLPDRYYVPQTYTLEQDAVLVGQPPSSETMLFTPQAQANVTGTIPAASFVLFRIEGNASTVASSGTAQVYSTFVSTEMYTSANGSNPFPATISLATLFPCAWAQFFNSTYNATFAPLGPPFVTVTVAGHPYSPGVCRAPGTPQIVSVRLPRVNSFMLTEVLIIMNVGTGNAPR